MSTIKAKISAIKNKDTLHLLHFEGEGFSLSMLTLELDAAIQVGKKVALLVKPTAVELAKEPSNAISHTNQLPCRISSIEEGDILSTLTLTLNEQSFESIITTEALKRMHLKEKSPVVALIPESELSIVELLDD